MSIIETNTIRYKDKTGKSWSEWIIELNGSGCSQLDDLTQYLIGQHQLDPHWAQLLAMRFYLKQTRYQAGRM